MQHSCLIKAQVYNRARHRAKAAVVWKHALRFGPSRAGAGRCFIYSWTFMVRQRLRDSGFRDEGPSTAEQPWICRLGGLQRPPSTLLPGGDSVLLSQRPSSGMASDTARDMAIKVLVALCWFVSEIKGNSGSGTLEYYGDSKQRHAIPSLKYSVISIWNGTSWPSLQGNGRQEHFTLRSMITACSQRLRCNGGTPARRYLVSVTDETRNIHR